MYCIVVLRLSIRKLNRRDSELEQFGNADATGWWTAWRLPACSGTSRTGNDFRAVKICCVDEVQRFSRVQHSNFEQLSKKGVDFLINCSQTEQFTWQKFFAAELGSITDLQRLVRVL
jgi:hypothetical protein